MSSDQPSPTPAQASPSGTAVDAQSTAEPLAQEPTPARSQGPIVLGLLALIIGVVGFVLALIPALGIALGLVAIVIGVISLRKRWARGLATAGVVIGAVAAMFSVVVFMLVTITPYMIEQEQQQIELQQP